MKALSSYFYDVHGLLPVALGVGVAILLVAGVGLAARRKRKLRQATSCPDVDVGFRAAAGSESIDRVLALLHNSAPAYAASDALTLVVTPDPGATTTYVRANPELSISVDPDGTAVIDRAALWRLAELTRQAEDGTGEPSIILDPEFFEEEPTRPKASPPPVPARTRRMTRA